MVARTLRSFVLPLFLASFAAAHAGIADHVQRGSAAGIDVYVDHTSVPDLVVVTGCLPAGDVFNPAGDPAVAQLTAGMLDNGTMRHDKAALAQQLESLGASISFTSGPEVVTFSARCLKDDLPTVIALLAEELRTPAFAADEFAKYQKHLVGLLRERLESTSARAGEAFARAVFPSGNPNRPASTGEMIAAVQRTTVGQLRAFHAAHYGAAHLTLVAVGDVELDALTPLLTRDFAGWSGGSPLPAPGPAAAAPVEPRTETVTVPGKASVDIVLGQATGLRFRDADTLALRAGTMILGSGFTSRLMGTVRDREGLTYGIGASLQDDTFTAGSFRISATFAPALLARGLASTRRQLQQWCAGGVTEAELAAKKQNMVGSFEVDLATTDALARNILLAVERGVGVAWLDTYPQQVKALTTAEVNAAIHRYLAPDQMTCVEAGTIGR